MDLAELGLVLDSRGAVRALNLFTGSAHNAGRATEHFERTTKNLTASLRVLGGYFGVRQLVEYADTWSLINARVNLTSKSHEEAMGVQQRLFEISQRTRNTLAATSVLYNRLALGANELGRSQQEMLDVTEAVNAGMLISGATGVEAAQSMRQLAQAFSKGKLDGDEFRTVMEAMPAVAQSIADQLGVTRGELLKLAPQGKITANTIIEGLLAAHDELVKTASDMPITIGQSFELMNNSITRMIGIINQATGASALFAKAIGFVADNMDRVVAILGALIAASITYRGTVLGIVGTYKLLVWWTQRAAFYQAILTATGAVQAWISLAKGVRSVADATALLGMVSKGVIGILATIAAVTVGFIAYKKMIKEIQEETDKWEKAQANLNEKIGEYKPPVDEEAAKRIREVAIEIEDMIRLGHQQVVLAGLQDTAEKQMEIRFAAINKAIAARRDLTGNLLRDMLGAIAVEEALALEALQIETAVERASEATEEYSEVLKNFAENLQRSFADTFYKILKDGLSSFKELFTGIRDMFLRLLSEMVAAKMMQSFGARLAAALGGLFAASPEALLAQQAGALARNQAGGHMAGAGAGAVAVTIEGFTVTAARSLLSQIASFAGPAAGGFLAGGMVGSLTQNRGVGVAGGALAGAGAGAAIGSVVPVVGTAVGAVIGGVTGAIGGWISSNKNHQAEMERHREAVENNSSRLAQLRASIEGGDAARFSGAAELAKIAAIITGSGDMGAKMLDPKVRQDLERLSKELGITLFDGNKVIDGAVEQFEEAIELTIIAITQFGRNLTDITMRINAYNKIFDVPQNAAQSLKDSFTILSEMAPDLVKRLGLGNVDLATQEGRTQLSEALKRVYEMIVSGELTPELLGAFTDKNQLLDSILKVKDGLIAFDEQLNKVTTDFPRAMDIIYYEQKFGRWGTTGVTTQTAANGAAQPAIVINGDVVIENNTGDSGEDVLNKVERAARSRRSRGGTVNVEQDRL